MTEVINNISYPGDSEITSDPELKDRGCQLRDFGNLSLAQYVGEYCFVHYSHVPLVFHANRSTHYLWSGEQMRSPCCLLAVIGVCDGGIWVALSGSRAQGVRWCYLI